jgi:hypothetical protein
MYGVSVQPRLPLSPVTDSGSVSPGSNPGPAANKMPAKHGKGKARCLRRTFLMPTLSEACGTMGVLREGGLKIV